MQRHCSHQRSTVGVNNIPKRLVSKKPNPRRKPKRSITQTDVSTPPTSPPVAFQSSCKESVAQISFSQVQLDAMLYPAFLTEYSTHHDNLKLPDLWQQTCHFIPPTRTPSTHGQHPQPSRLGQILYPEMTSDEILHNLLSWAHSCQIRINPVVSFGPLSSSQNDINNKACENSTNWGGKFSLPPDDNSIPLTSPNAAQPNDPLIAIPAFLILSPCQPMYPPGAQFPQLELDSPESVPLHAKLSPLQPFPQNLPVLSSIDPHSPSFYHTMYTIQQYLPSNHVSTLFLLALRILAEVHLGTTSCYAPMLFSLPANVSGHTIHATDQIIKYIQDPVLQYQVEQQHQDFQQCWDIFHTNITSITPSQHTSIIHTILPDNISNNNNNNNITSLADLFHTHCLNNNNGDSDNAITIDDMKWAYSIASSRAFDVQSLESPIRSFLSPPGNNNHSQFGIIPIVELLNCSSLPTAITHMHHTKIKQSITSQTTPDQFPLFYEQQFTNSLTSFWQSNLVIHASDTIQCQFNDTITINYNSTQQTAATTATSSSIEDKDRFPTSLFALNKLYHAIPTLNDATTVATTSKSPAVPFLQRVIPPASLLPTFPINNTTTDNTDVNHDVLPTTSLPSWLLTNIWRNPNISQTSLHDDKPSYYKLITYGYTSTLSMADIIHFKPQIINQFVRQAIDLSKHAMSPELMRCIELLLPSQDILSTTGYQSPFGFSVLGPMPRTLALMRLLSLHIMPTYQTTDYINNDVMNRSLHTIFQDPSHDDNGQLANKVQHFFGQSQHIISKQHEHLTTFLFVALLYQNDVIQYPHSYRTPVTLSSQLDTYHWGRVAADTATTADNDTDNANQSSQYHDWVHQLSMRLAQQSKTLHDSYQRLSCDNSQENNDADLVAHVFRHDLLMTSLQQHVLETSREYLDWYG